MARPEKASWRSETRETVSLVVRYHTTVCVLLKQCYEAEGGKERILLDPSAAAAGYPIDEMNGVHSQNSH